MARAIRASASASSALIVHSEKGLDSRKLDEGPMAHPPFGMPLPCESNYGRVKIVPSMRQSYAPETHPSPGPRPRILSGMPLRRRSRGKREVCDPAAAAGQPQECVALVHRLPDTPGSPVGIGFHGGDH